MMNLDSASPLAFVLRPGRGMTIEHFDVLVVGAGISGIGAGYHLQTELPGRTYAILEARESHRRNLGSLPLPRHPLRLRHVHARLLVPALGRRQGDRRRGVDPEYIRRDREGARHRPEDPLRPPRQARDLVVRGRALDGRGGARASQEDGAPHLQLPLHVQRLLQLRRGLHAGVPRHRALRGPHRSPAEVDRRRRLRRQARGRDRQRRDRRDARAGAGEDGRARHHAAALADATSSPCPSRTDRELAAPLPARDGRLRRSRAGRTCCSACCSSASPARSRARQDAHPRVA